MLTVEEARRALSDRNVQKVADKTGLHPSTIYKIAQGRAKRPSFQTMAALSAYLETIPEESTP